MSQKSALIAHNTKQYVHNQRVTGWSLFSLVELNIDIKKGLQHGVLLSPAGL